MIDFSENHPVSEEVGHGDVTAGVRCMWNVFTADKYTGVAFSLKRHFASSFFGGHTGADP